MPNHAAVLKEQYQNSIGLPFAEAWSEAQVQAVLDVQDRQALHNPILGLQFPYLFSTKDCPSEARNSLNNAQ